MPDDDTKTPQTVDIGDVKIPIRHIKWADWQTCRDVPDNPHWHTYDDDGKSICTLRKAG